MSLSAPSIDAPPSRGTTLRKQVAALLGGRVHPLDKAGSGVCRGILAIYLAGFYLMFAPWWQFTWLMAALALAYDCVDWRNLWGSLRRDAMVRMGALFLGWMTLRSLLAIDAASPVVRTEATVGLGGMLWLLVFAALVWQAAINLRALEPVGLLLGVAAALATVVSIVMFYIVLPGHTMGERLSNWFVYWGLNPVCTGLTFGFAAMWVSGLTNYRSSRTRTILVTLMQVILILGVLLTRSRGALLALAVGHMALTLAQGWQKTRWRWLTLAIVIVIFQLGGPLVTALSVAQTQARAASSGAVETNVQSHSPLKELVDRADSGRIEIYRAGIAALPDAKAWLFGTGEWGTDASWRSRLDSQPNHLHSVPLSTLVHGGLIGLVLLLAFIALGFRRAWWLAKNGHPLWWSLLAFGSAGLIFDGQSLCCMTTMPAFEPLLLLFPLITAASGWAHHSFSDTASS